ncbi:symplekin [Ceratobasidium sp. AG-Ba]|nr:symplekin [Ceratobasidium sp. AG-Ba]
MDPNAFNAALNAPAGSDEQIQILAGLRTSLELQPATIPIFLATLAGRMLAQPGESIVKQWMMDLVLFGMTQAQIAVDGRSQIASATLDAQVNLLNENATVYVKGGIQCLAASYPLLFRVLCTNRSARQQWDTLNAAKARILPMVDDATLPLGIRLSAIKFMQRTILVQTRGVNDPRVVLQNKGDPNLSMCPSDHPFISVVALETEGGELVKKCIMMLYTASNMDILSALINTLATLFKQRPPLAHLIIQAVIAWTPASMGSQSAMSIRSVEKSVKILLQNLYRSPQGAPYARQIADAIQAQTARMEQAAQEARRKRVLEAEAAESAKRTKLEPPVVPTPPNIDVPTPVPAPAPVAAPAFGHFDFSTLPLPLVVDILIANLQALSDERLATAISARKLQLSRPPAVQQPTSVDGPPLLAPAPQAPGPSPAQLESQTQRQPPVEAEPAVKEEPLDPLKMDIDDDDLEYEPDKLNVKPTADQEEDEPIESTALDPSVFALPPPKDLSDETRHGLVRSSVTRIWDAGEGQGEIERVRGRDGDVGLPPEEMWMLVVVRMITRGAGAGTNHVGGGGKTLVHQGAFREDGMRQMVLDYMLDDFGARMRLAIVWMNEEWYNDRVQAKAHPNREPKYETWLVRLAVALKARIESKDKNFARFLMELPVVPAEVLSLCRELAETPQQMHVGFAALREFINLRPPVRSQAMQILLNLTAHNEKVTRNAAINTVRRWVPDSEPMNGIIAQFARKLLKRLETHTSTDEPAGTNEASVEPEDIPRYLPRKLELPAKKSEVIQHVELMFALSVRVPVFLDEIFAAYVHMETSVQEALQDLLAPLVRSLGPTNPKLLSLIKSFEPGAESLILRIIKILTENGRPNANLVALVKELIAERNLDARFLMPIIGEMDKPDIMKNLPRIVGMLNGKPEPKALVKSAFQAIVAAPPDSFTKGSSNQPRMKQSEQLTPVDLMVLLHEDKDIGIKPAIEAIGICFQIVDVFRSDVLAAVMQQLLDSPTLPTLFLRTASLFSHVPVIQAVTTYKNLVGYVSTTLLSRLITKKIWTNGPLWEGFIRCAKVIAPASFGALLQLPREQLKELISKQPALKEDLREYVIRRAGPKARLLEVFSDQPESGGTAPEESSSAPAQG